MAESLMLMHTKGKTKLRSGAPPPHCCADMMSAHTNGGKMRLSYNHPAGGLGGNRHLLASNRCQSEPI